MPIPGDSLTFGAAGAGGLNLDNNLTNGSFNVAGITFNSGAGAFLIGNGTKDANVGNAFALTGPITNNSTALQTISNPFSMMAVRTFTTTAGDIKLGGKISGTLGGITKLGAGTLTLNGSAASTFTGGLSIYAGTLLLDFANLDTPMNLIDSDNALTLGSGTLSIRGSTSGSTSQTVASLTITGGAQILLNPRGGIGTTTTIPLGSIATVNAVGCSLLVGTVAGAGGGNAVITTIDSKDSKGIYGGRIVYMLGGGTSVDWATTASADPTYTFGAYNAYTTMVAGTTSDSSNDIIGNLALTGDHTHNTLKLTGGATLVLGTNTLTLTSGGLLSTGTGASTISGDAGVTRLIGGDNGSGSYDLIVHQYNADGLTISAVIGDNGAHPTALTKTGAYTLTLSGANTYTGDTIVNEGTLSIGNAYLNDLSTVKIDMDAKMHLNFSGEPDQIAELWLGGEMMDPGDYYMDMPGTEGYGSYFTGAGKLKVVLVRLPGDANEDGVVDAADFIALKKNFGMGSGATLAVGNFNTDDAVNWADLTILMNNMDPGVGPTTTAPEPCSAMLLVFGAATLLRPRRRRGRNPELASGLRRRLPIL